MTHRGPFQPLPFCELHFQFLSLLPTSSAGEQGTWVAVSSSHIISAAPSSSQGGLLTLFLCSIAGSLCGRQSSTTFCNVSPSHGLQFFMNCSSVGPPWGHKPCQQTCSTMGSSHSTGPQVLPGACSSTGSPQGHSLFWASSCSGVGSSVGCRWISAPPWTSMGCRGTTCLAMVFSTGCRGISAPAPGAPPSHPSSLTLVSAELFLLHLLGPLSWLLLLLHSSFSPLLNYVMPEVLPPSLMGLALASSGSVLDLAGTGSIKSGGSFWQLLAAATSVAPLLQIPCHANPIYSHKRYH